MKNKTLPQIFTIPVSEIPKPKSYVLDKWVSETRMRQSIFNYFIGLGWKAVVTNCKVEAHFKDAYVFFNYTETNADTYRFIIIKINGNYKDAAALQDYINEHCK